MKALSKKIREQCRSQKHFKIFISPSKKKKRNKPHTHKTTTTNPYKELSSNTIDGQKIGFLSNKFSIGVTLFVHT